MLAQLLQSILVYSHDRMIAREIRTHRQAIELFQGRASASDLQLRMLARRLLPQLRKHLAMWESLKSENLNARR
jgi:predicted outer membrane protein